MPVPVVNSANYSPPLPKSIQSVTNCHWFNLSSAAGSSAAVHIVYVAPHAVVFVEPEYQVNQPAQELPRLFVRFSPSACH
jgi:hypothetical protein